MPLREEDVSDLIRSIYRCAADPSQWRNFIRELDRKLDSVYLSLYGHDAVTGVCLGSVASKYRDDFRQRYETDLHTRNPFVPALARAKEMDFQCADFYVDRAVLERSEFYADFLQPQEDIVAGGGGVVFNEADRMLILNGQVRRRDEDHKTAELVEALRLLAPHVRQAFEIGRAVAGRSLRDPNFLSILDQLGRAVFILDAEGRIEPGNPAAEEELRLGSHLMTDAGGRMRLVDGSVRRIIAAELAAIRSGRPARGQRGALVATDGTALSYVFMPTCRDDDFGPLFALLDAHRPPAALLVLQRRGPGSRGLLDGLAQAYGATPAEIELAGNLFDGLSIAEDAEARGVSVQTARHQLKSLFRKTDTSRQGELVALLHRLFG